MLDTNLIDRATEAFIGRNKTYVDVCAMDFVDLVYRVRENRWEHPELEQLNVSDRAIAEAIVERAISKAPDSRVIIIKLLAEQRRQTRLLKTVAWAAGLWLALMILQMVAEIFQLF